MNEPELVVLGDTQDRYTPDPGTHGIGVEICCGVCGTPMEVFRNALGPRGFAQAMGGGKSPHDAYTCPHRGEDWHEQVVALRQEAKKTPSMRLAKIMLEEAGDILETKKVTKKIT